MKQTSKKTIYRRTRGDSGQFRRIRLAMAVLGLAAFFPVAARLYSLMVSQYGHYAALALGNQSRSTPIQATRGEIYDRNMNVLAASRTVENVYIDPRELHQTRMDIEGVCDALSEILEVDREKVAKLAADQTRRYHLIRDRVEEETAGRVRDYINENNITGIHLEPNTERVYPCGTLAAQVIGFTNASNQGAEGIEASYDHYLSGEAGKVSTTKGNNEMDMPYSVERFLAGKPGASVVTTLDVTVQACLEQGMQDAIDRYRVLNGAFGMVMDVDTGEILAMATLGSYDPNNYLEITDETTSNALEELRLDYLRYDPDSPEYRAGKDAYRQALVAARLKQWRNRCLSDGYEPGSTFKLITLAAGLDSGCVSLNDTYVCNGTGHKFYGRTQEVDCWKHSGHGSQTTAEALAHSCNPAVSMMSTRMGGETMYSYIKAFGFLEKTEVDLPGETKGLFFDYYNYIDPDQTASLISSSFGQTFRITPLQLVRAVAAVVNGGYLLEPYIVSEVQDSDGNTLSRTEPTILRQVISEETSATMRTLMEGVVTDGTASKASVAGYRVGGKTGTSEKIDVFDENGERVDDKICSFVGVAPIDDPKYVVLVVLDTPNDEIGQLIGGGAMAAPTVSGVFEDILPYLGVEPKYSEKDMNMVIMTMPDLTGKTEGEAEFLLDEKNLSYRKVGNGATITGQIPAAGMSIPGKSTVILYFGEEAKDDLVEVPDLMSYSIGDCYYLTRNSGIYVLVRGANIQSGNVLATYQNIPAGTMVPRGTMVTVEFTDYTVSGE